MTKYAPEATAAESPFSESEVTDLAAQLLGVSSDRQLNRFLRKLLRRAARAVGGALHSAMLYPLGALVKGAVRKILPGIGRAFSGLLDPTGGDVDQGGQMRPLAARASQSLGIELEGLSGEDQEFAAAKQLVRLAGTAAAQAALHPSRRNAGEANETARQAMIQATQAYAPGLLRSASSHHHSHHEQSHSHGETHHDCGCGGTCGGCGGGSKAGSGTPRDEPLSGSWVRRGHEIILEGL